MSGDYWNPTTLEAVADEPDDVQDELATLDGLVAMFNDRPDGDDREAGQ